MDSVLVTGLCPSIPAVIAGFVAFDHRLGICVLERLTWEEAAAIPVSSMTDHNALITCIEGEIF